MRIAIAIPSRGRPRELERTLVALGRHAAATTVLDQSVVPLEHDRARIVHDPWIAGLPAARNRLLTEIDAEWVLFLDDDAEIADDFLDRLAELIAAHQEVVAWGPVVEARGRWLRRAHRLLQLGVLRDPRRLTWGPADLPTRALFGCCFAVRRDAALSCGGFDASREGYALGEDLDFFLRLRGEKRFARALRCVHRESPRGRSDAEGRGRAKAATLRWLARRHGGRDPATLLHLGLALVGAALAGRRARERITLRGLADGLHHDPFSAPL